MMMLVCFIYRLLRISRVTAPPSRLLASTTTCLLIATIHLNQPQVLVSISTIITVMFRSVFSLQLAFVPRGIFISFGGEWRCDSKTTLTLRYSLPTVCQLVYTLPRIHPEVQIFQASHSTLHPSTTRIIPLLQNRLKV